MTNLDERLRILVAELLEMAIPPGADVERATTAAWDSLNHLRIVMAVEEEFSIRLEPDEVLAITALSSLSNVVEDKIGARDGVTGVEAGSLGAQVAALQTT
jgi:acyl carrier protein